MLVNGKEEQFDGSLSAYLEARSIAWEMVVVEINGLIVEKHTYLTRMLQPDDKIEIVSFVGGG